MTDTNDRIWELVNRDTARLQDGLDRINQQQLETLKQMSSLAEIRVSLSNLSQEISAFKDIKTLAEENKRRHEMRDREQASFRKIATWGVSIFGAMMAASIYTQIVTFLEWYSKQ